MPRTSEFISSSHKKEIGNAMIWAALEKNHELTLVQLRRITINLYGRLKGDAKAYKKIRKFIRKTR